MYEKVEEWVTDLLLRGYSDHTVRVYRRSVENALEFIGKDYKKVTTQDLKKFLLEQQKKGNSLKTIRFHVNAWRSFFQYFEIDIADKIRLPRVPKTLPVFLNMGEMKTLLDTIEKVRDLVIVRLLYSSGLRVSELVNLNKEDVEENTIYVRSGKGKKDRVVYIDDGTLQLLKEYQKGRRDRNKALFVNRRGKRLSGRYIEIMVKKYGKKAGIKKNVTPHVLRHTFATHLLQNDANIVVIQKLLGHTSLSTTQIYTHVTDEYKRESYEKAHPLSNPQHL